MSRTIRRHAETESLHWIFDRLRYATLFLIVLLLSGCGGQESHDRNFDNKLDAVDSEIIEKSVGRDESAGESARLVSETGEVAVGEVTLVRRRIVYDAELSLVVVSYGAFESEIGKIVERYDGFISKSETNRRYEDRQSGTWVARIPVANYSKFLNAVVELGFPESRTEEAQDITADFVDVEARMKNNQKLESRILEILEVREGKISDVLEIEQELARVRDEIERMQGRLRVLADQSSLATITMNVREERQYVPPTAPTLSSRINSTWRGSLGGLRDFGEVLVIVVVAVMPWLFVLGLASLIIYLIVRIARR